ncbi:MAG TPA: alcohol dehydrogenase catalytic domain-containing protein [Thermoanaerobaculia bacterium]|nr:alcohol dehydrogenase catalytic domain-containing protein [Thermoanaerobaculia bacterium]
MRAIVLRGIGSVELAERPEPRLEQPGDALVRVTTAAICGSDLHVVEGRDRGVRPGTILGHELVGVVEALAGEVPGLAAGDRVLAPFTVSCGECFFCRRGLTARCVRSQCFGFVDDRGEGLEGAQAELVRVPLAASTLLRVPAARPDGTAVADEDVLFLGDVFSTAVACAEGAAFAAGDTVAVIGCGPIGLLSVVAARWLGAGAVVAVDSIDYRLDKAAALGATVVNLGRDGGAGALSRVLAELTEGRGADAALEAVGTAAALDLALQAVRPGGVVSVAGYHTADVFALPVHAAYAKNLTLRFGRCSARAMMERLLPRVLAERLPLTEIISHVLPLRDGPRGYELFGRRQDAAIKVLLKPGE